MARIKRAKRFSHPPRATALSEPRARIAVAVPSHSVVPLGFAYDLANLAGFTASIVPDDTMLSLLTNEGTYVHRMRQELLERSLGFDADWLLWLDSDMRFPKDALVRLLAHREAIVGVNYATRKLPVGFTALKREGEWLATRESSAGLEEVESLGFGCVLMDLRRVVPALGEPPWFRNDFEPTPDGKLRPVGEDFFFCRRAREGGLRLFVDHDLSKLCAHVGTFDFRPGHAEAWQEGETSFDGAASPEASDADATSASSIALVR